MKKIRTTCRKGETSVEYVKFSEVDLLRKKVLRYITESRANKITLFLDTNNAIYSLSEEVVKQAMSTCGIEHIVEEVAQPERKLMGISVPFKKSGKKDSDKVYIALASIDGNTDLDTLYTGLLQYLDYALCGSGERSPDELINLFRRGPEKALFNKDIFDFTFYDSVLVKRMRIDSEDRELVELMNNLRNSI